APKAVPVLRQPKLVSCRITTRGLYGDCLERCFERQVTTVYIGPDLDLLRPHTLFRVQFLLSCLLQPEMPVEAGEDRERHGDAGAEGLTGKIEREDTVLTGD